MVNFEESNAFYVMYLHTCIAWVGGLSKKGQNMYLMYGCYAHLLVQKAKEEGDKTQNR